jgi:hypothetical protein
MDNVSIIGTTDKQARMSARSPRRPLPVPSDLAFKKRVCVMGPM